MSISCTGFCVVQAMHPEGCKNEVCKFAHSKEQQREAVAQQVAKNSRWGHIVVSSGAANYGGIQLPDGRWKLTPKQYCAYFEGEKTALYEAYNAHEEKTAYEQHCLNILEQLREEMLASQLAKEMGLVEEEDYVIVAEHDLTEEEQEFLERCIEKQDMEEFGNVNPEQLEILIDRNCDYSADGWFYNHTKVNRKLMSAEATKLGNRRLTWGEVLGC